MGRELFREIIQTVKAVTGVKAFLVLLVAALYLAVVSGSIGEDELAPDIQASTSGFKQSGNIPSAVGETVGEFKAIVGLNALHSNASADIPLDQFVEKIRRGIGRLLRISSQKTQASELINGGILKQA